MEIVLKVFKQTSWQVLGKIFTALSTLFVLSLVSRNLGVNATGVFTLALAFLAFFYLAADFGLNAHTIPRLLEKKKTNEWQKLFGLRLLLSTALVCIAVLIIYFWPSFDSQFKSAALIGLLAIYANAVFISANAMFQAKLRYDLAVIAPIIGVVPTIGVVYLAVSYNLGVNGLMVAHVLGWVVCAFLALFFLKRFTPLTPVFDFKYMKSVLASSWPISATLVLNTIYFRIDAFLLSYFKSFYEVGIYNLAYQFFQFALIVPAFIINSLYPILLKRHADSRTEFLKLMISSSFIMLNLGIAATVVTFLGAPLVIELISGDTKFPGSEDALRILSLSFPAYFVSAVLMWALVVLRQYKKILLVYIIGLVINLGLNFYLIPLFSYLAAAWVTGICEYLILVLLIGVLYRSINR